MLKLVKNQENTVRLYVTSTIDLTGYVAKLSINGTDRVADDLTSKNAHFEITPSDIETLGNADYLAPLKVVDSNGTIFRSCLVAMKAVDSSKDAIGSDFIRLVVVGDIASPQSDDAAIIVEEIAARKEGDISTLNSAKSYTDEKIKKSKLFVYAGQVDTVDELPTTATEGEVYNVVETGANYAWNGEEWDKLSEDIDLSIFATKELLSIEEQARISRDNELSAAIESEASTRSSEIQDIRGDVDENTNAITTLSTSLETKASQESLDALITEVNGKATKSDLETLESIVGEKADNTSLESLSSTVESLKGVVNGKASQETLNALSTEVEGKANQSDLSALENTVGGKADNSALEALATTVNSKADKTTVENLATEVSGKASQSALNTLSTTVASKANSSDVSSLETKVNGILDGTTFISSLVFKKVDGSTTRKYRLQVALVDNGNGGTEPTLTLVEV